MTVAIAPVIVGVAPVVSAVSVIPMSAMPMVVDAFVVPVAVSVVGVQVARVLMCGHKAIVRKQWVVVGSVIPNNPNRFQPHHAVVFDD